MCWWVSYGVHSRDANSLRNIVAFIMQEYKSIANHELISIADECKTPIPHSINHEDRPVFVGIISTILGDDVKIHPQAIEIAKKIDMYNVNEKYLDDNVLSSLILTASEDIARDKTNKRDYAIPEHIALYVKKYSIVIRGAIKRYLTTGPEGSFTIDYVIQEIESLLEE